MYIYFTVFGILFVSVFAIVTNYLYELFPINKITNFFAPLGKGVWQRINGLVLPTILWGFIELPILGDLSFFWLAILLNICVSSAVMYVIKYSADLIFKKQNNVINLIAILGSTIIGFILSYLVFMISSNGNYLFISIGALLILLVMYTLLLFFPPKSEFFRGKEE